MKPTAKPNLVYYQVLKYQPENLERLSAHFNVISLPDPSHDNAEVLMEAEVILAPLGYYCGPHKIDCAKKLRVIGSNTTGHPHIDVDHAQSRQIKVVTLKGHHDFLDKITPTAELTWGLIIALTRNIVPGFRAVLEGQWDRRPFGGQAMLSRMKLGIAGYGRLGKIVSQYGRCFGMSVMYYDPYVDPVDHDEHVKRVHNLHELVAQCDIVSIHIPHEPETEKLFSQKVFRAFKQGAYLINTSRGEIVDSDALLKALGDGTLAGAAIDVIDQEFEPDFQSLMPKHPLWQYAATHSNLLITPHIGGSTFDAWRLTEAYTIDLIIEALKDSSNQG